MFANAPVMVCPNVAGIVEFPIISVLLFHQRRSFSYQRRSATSKTSLIGNSQIPATLGQTITGALANIPFPFGIDNDGNYGYYKAGADSVTPFKSGIDISNAYISSFTVPTASSASYTLPNVSKCKFMMAQLIFNSSGYSCCIYLDGEFIVGFNSGASNKHFMTDPVVEAESMILEFTSPNTVYAARLSSYNPGTWYLLYY